MTPIVSCTRYSSNANPVAIVEGRIAARVVGLMGHWPRPVGPEATRTNFCRKGVSLDH